MNDYLKIKKFEKNPSKNHPLMKFIKTTFINLDKLGKFKTKKDSLKAL